MTNRRGQALVEYAIIVALIGACLVAILGLVGHAARNTYARSTSQIAHQTDAGYGTNGGGVGGGSGGGWSGGPQVIPASASADNGRGAGSPPDSAGSASPDSVGVVGLFQ